jgi:hypothetical protein
MTRTLKKFKYTGKDSDALDAAGILDNSAEVLKIMREGAEQIKSAPEIGLTETIAILGL